MLCVLIQWNVINYWYLLHTQGHLLQMNLNVNCNRAIIYLFIYFPACYFSNSGLECLEVVTKNVSQVLLETLLKWSMHVYSWRKWEKLFLFREKKIYVWDNFLPFQRTLFQSTCSQSNTWATHLLNS